MENCNREILSSRPDVFQPLVRSLFSTATAYSIFMDGGVVGGEERAGVGQGVGGGRKKQWSWWVSCVCNEQIFHYHYITTIFCAYQFRRWESYTQYWIYIFIHHIEKYVEIYVVAMLLSPQTIVGGLTQQRVNASKKGVRRMTNRLATLRRPLSMKYVENCGSLSERTIVARRWYNNGWVSKVSTCALSLARPLLFHTLVLC